MNLFHSAGQDSLHSPNHSPIIYLLLFAGAFCSLVAFMLRYPARAGELIITGHASGQGVQLLNYAGEMLNFTLTQNATDECHRRGFLA